MFRSLFQDHLQGLSLTLTTALYVEGVGDQRHAPAVYPPRKRRGNHCTEHRVDPRAGLYKCGKISPNTGIRSADLPAIRQSLYRLSYPAPGGLRV
jgi:hypothetical protein